MSDLAIRVENLGKRYKIGARVRRHDTLRDALMARVGRRTEDRGRKTDSRPPSPVPGQADTIWALKDVSFEVRRGEVVGIIGRNGAGKSTLLKILSRITEPTEGGADIYGRVGTLLEVGTGFHPELTGRENIFLSGAILGMRKAEIERRFDEIVAFAEIDKFIDTPVKRYSSGMYVRLAFAVAAHLEPEILLVDEVLAVGDAAFQKKCLGKMGDVAKEGRTVLFVSHNMAAIQGLCLKGVYLLSGKIGGMGEVQDIIRLYLGEAGSSDVRFEDKPLKSARVRQVEDKLELVVEYALEHEITIPSLGFVISDLLGNPICGTNPMSSLLTTEQFFSPKRAGSVRVIIDSPKLLNGTYRLSLWFGNGRVDYFHARDCLRFDVVNMAGPRQLSPSVVGFVSPDCKWIFE